MATSQSCEEASLELDSGKWLTDGNNEIVLNQELQNEEKTALGDTIDLVVQGKARPFTVIGFAREIGGGAIGYVTRNDFSSNYQKEGIRVINIDTGLSDIEKINQVRNQLEEELAEKQIDVLTSQTELESQEKLNNHLVLITSTLVGMSVLASIVGVMGLYSTISINITERTREIGVLRSIGCKNHQMIKIYSGEASILGIISFTIGLLLSIPLTFVLGDVFGSIFLKTGLNTAFSWSSAGLCICGILLICILVNAILISHQYQLEIREAITYE